MSKLLRSGFRRYLTSFIFWIAVVATIGIAVFCSLEARQFGFEDFFITIFLIVNAVMISWIVGRENEEGIFRNKIISGHTKGDIYFSELILGIVFSVILYFLFAVIFLCFNSYIIGHAPVSVAMKIFLGGFLASACLAAILVTISCSLSHRAITGIVNILLVLALVFATQTIDSMLDRPEYWEEYDYEYVEVVDENGNVNIGMSTVEDSMHLVKNHGYIKSPTREILSAVGRLSMFTPFREGGDVTYGWFGYTMQVSSTSSGTSHYLWESEANFSVSQNEKESLDISPIFSFMELIAIGCVGYFFFRKKELK